MSKVVSKGILATGLVVAVLFLVSQPACQQSKQKQEAEQSQEQTRQKKEQVQKQAKQKSGQKQVQQKSDQRPGPNKSVDVSDEELEQFVNVQQKLREMQGNAREKIVSIIEDSDIDKKTYRMISAKMRQADSKDEIDASESEIKQTQKISNEVNKIRKSMQQKQMKMIQNEEMSQQRFKQIGGAIRQDPELKKRVKKMTKEE